MFQVGLLIYRIIDSKTKPSPTVRLAQNSIKQSIIEMSGTASALQIPNEGDRAQTSDLSTPKATDAANMTSHDSATVMPDAQRNGVDSSTSRSQDAGETRSPQPTSLEQIMTSNTYSRTTPPSSPGTSYPPPLQLEYSSSAPMPQTSKEHTVALGDPEVPSHLYTRLPKHFLHKEEGSDELVPDYMRMILLCEY